MALEPLTFKELRQVRIDYTNWKGIRSIRTITPRALVFGCSPHHPEFQWCVDAFDEDKKENRVFAMKDIHSWHPVR